VAVTTEGGGGEVGGGGGQLHDKILSSTCQDIRLMLILPLAVRLKLLILF
jgi:hypothetical protein